jgi:predicted XRE-type DNA-binding protein
MTATKTDADAAHLVVLIARVVHFEMSEDAVGQIEIVPVLDAALAEEVSQTRHAREQAERLRADASAQTRRTAQHLKDQGMAQRDISTLLGISHQAVSQLLAR